MKVLSATYSESRDDTKIKFTLDFLTTDWVTKADVLRDLIGMLSTEYEAHLKENSGIHNEILGHYHG